MHEAHVINAPAEHGEAVEAHAKGEALAFRWVNACILENVGMYHAGTHHLYPLVA